MTLAEVIELATPLLTALQRTTARKAEVSITVSRSVFATLVTAAQERVVDVDDRRRGWFSASYFRINIAVGTITVCTEDV